MEYHELATITKSELIFFLTRYNELLTAADKSKIYESLDSKQKNEAIITSLYNILNQSSVVWIEDKIELALIVVMHIKDYDVFASTFQSAKTIYGGINKKIKFIIINTKEGSYELYRFKGENK
jgi:hypothetical protein